MKKILFFTACFFVVGSVFSQSDKQLTHYMFDKMSFNPATTGFKGYCATAIYRGQWDKVENAPNTMLINLQGNLQKYNSGVGLSFMNDVIGLGKEMEINLNYAYHYNVDGYGFLSGGIGLGIENVAFDPKWNAPQTGGDITLDPNLPQGASGTGLNVNFGLHWKGASLPYYVGLSMTHLNEPTLENVNFTKARHYYILAGYDVDARMFQRMPRGLSFKPSILFKTDAVAGILDFNVLADYWFSDNMTGLYGGMTYRNKDAFALMIGIQKKLPTASNGIDGTLNGPMDVVKFGYSYDIMTGPLAEYGSGSHELFFNYCMFPPPPPVQRYGNVFILE